MQNMRKFHLTHPAREDIKRALQISLEKHGLQARLHYEQLITIALTHLRAIKTSLEPIGSSSFDDTIFRKYHLLNVKKEATKKGFRVKKPSHIFFYEVTNETIIVHALLPEMRDFIQHLP